MKVFALAALLATAQAAAGAIETTIATTCDSTVTADADFTAQNKVCSDAVGAGSCCVSADTADATNVSKCTTTGGVGDTPSTFTCLVDGASKLAAGAAVLAAALYL